MALRFTSSADARTFVLNFNERNEQERKKKAFLGKLLAVGQYRFFRALHLVRGAKLLLFVLLVAAVWRAGTIPVLRFLSVAYRHTPGHDWFSALLAMPKGVAFLIILATLYVVWPRIQDVVRARISRLGGTIKRTATSSGIRTLAVLERKALGGSGRIQRVLLSFVLVLGLWRRYIWFGLLFAPISVVAGLAAIALLLRVDTFVLHKLSSYSGVVRRSGVGVAKAA